MTVRMAERADHLWIHDRDDHLDHAMRRRDLIDAARWRAEWCRAACGHPVRVGRYDVAHDRPCSGCVELVPRPPRWRRMFGKAS